MYLSVIIPVYNAQRTLRDCLQALSRQTHRHYEVLLVDNNSTDESVNIIETFLRAHPEFEARLLREPIQGACRARNTGAKVATGDILVNTDPDCIPDRRWLADLVEDFHAFDTAMVAGNIKPPPPNNTYELFSSLFTLPGRSSTAVHDRYTLTHGGYATANLSIRRRWFFRVGGFDETINYHGVGIGEDHDLIARVYRMGGKLVAVPNATVEHRHRSHGTGIARQGFLFGLAHAVLTRRYGPSGLLCTLGGKRLVIRRLPRGWIDVNGFDKKLLFFCLLTLMNPKLVVVLGIYLVWQVWKVRKRAMGHGFSASGWTSIHLLMLLLVKSSSMSLGRLRGGAREKIICL